MSLKEISPHPDLIPSFASREYGLTRTQLVQIYDRNIIVQDVSVLSRYVFRFRRTNERTRSGRSGVFAFSAKRFNKSSLPPLLTPPTQFKRSRRMRKKVAPFVVARSKKLKILLPGLERIRRRFVLAVPFFELYRHKEQSRCNKIAIRMKKMYACRVLFDLVREYMFVPTVRPRVTRWRGEAKRLTSSLLRQKSSLIQRRVRTFLDRRRRVRGWRIVQEVSCMRIQRRWRKRAKLRNKYARRIQKQVREFLLRRRISIVLKHMEMHTRIRNTRDVLIRWKAWKDRVVREERRRLRRERIRKEREREWKELESSTLVVQRHVCVIELRRSATFSYLSLCFTFALSLFFLFFFLAPSYTPNPPYR